MKPELTVSGYRGIWGETLTEDIARGFAEVFARFVHKRRGERVLIGRDARNSGDTIVRAVAETLSNAGLHVTVGGILPTPTVLFLVRTLTFDGAIIVTASHNPIEYNGLKFVTSHGMFTSEKEVAELKKYILEGLEIPGGGGSVSIDKHLGEKHVTHIIRRIDAGLIRNRRFRVVLDPINSAGAVLGPDLLKRLGCEVSVINGEPDGDFAHEPEPLPENLGGLAEEERRVGADIGFAQDPDADRLVVCDETGTIISEEYTLALAVLAVMQRTPGDIAINMSTSKTSEDIARAYGGSCYRTKVGEANVVEGILKHHAVIGGEGGGGVIYPAINPCRDSLTGIALILELLEKDGRPLSEIVASLPHYAMRKRKFHYAGKMHLLYEKMRDAFPDARANTLDGLRLDFPDGAWVHLRPSNTEPVVRLIGEAKMEERIDALMENVKNLLG